MIIPKLAFFVSFLRALIIMLCFSLLDKLSRWNLWRRSQYRVVNLRLWWSLEHFRWGFLLLLLWNESLSLWRLQSVSLFNRIVEIRSICCLKSRVLLEITIALVTISDLDSFPSYLAWRVGVPHYYLNFIILIKA